MLGRVKLDVHERRQLERKRSLIEERIRALESALDGNSRGGPLIEQERAGTQRMYLSIMQSKLKRINSELRQYANSGLSRPVQELIAERDETEQIPQ